LRVGQRGAFQGWQVTITGRVVLSVEIEGETYYWNEYILTGDNGASGTLVYEEGEDGPEWKLFRMFEPSVPLTAREAARLRVGDTVNLTGSPIAVTLVDESVVRLIEGTPPEGVERGDVAHYFNADTGRSMLVVSWTGDEIEFYEGHDLPEELVMKGFGLTSAQPERSSLPASGTKSRLGSVLFVLVGIAVAAFFISTCRPKPSRQTGSQPASYQPQPVVQLALGSSGTLEQRAYSVAAIASVTIGRREGAREDTEYLLRTTTGETALLTRGLMGGTRTWHLFTPTLPATVSPTLDSFSAAALPKSARINLAERGYQVIELLHAKAGAQQGGEAAAATWPAVQYGWLARGHEAGEAEDWLLARWTETSLQFHRGHSIPEAEVRAAFATVEK
ncbi:MAG TPA: DUF4178 domain-containing protein, partial [Opitutaceae bacterium]